MTARRKMFLKVSTGTIAYDTSFAKSIFPFASTIATFRGRSFKPAVVVVYKNFHMGFSGDAHMGVVQACASSRAHSLAHNTTGFVWARRTALVPLLTTRWLGPCARLLFDKFLCHTKLSLV